MDRKQRCDTKKVKIKKSGGTSREAATAARQMDRLNKGKQQRSTNTSSTTNAAVEMRLEKFEGKGRRGGEELQVI